MISPMKKKILFVINTLSRSGAELSLLTLLRSIDPDKYDLSLFVLTSQGEMADELPYYVTLLNKSFSSVSVLSREGRVQLGKKVFHDFFVRGTGFKLMGYLLTNFADMLKNGHVSVDKLSWRILSDSALRSDQHYDLAVAFIEGGSTYYVADHVKAGEKVAFVHILYQMAGYTRKLDQNCYAGFDRICAVSDEVKSSFLEVYPSLKDRTVVFHNLLDVEDIRRKAKLPGGFRDDFDGVRILTVGRLTAQKACETSIEAMSLLKKTGRKIRWYVLGEGDQRDRLEKKIRSLGLEGDFVLCGAVDNPYPYFAQCDLYVHASRYEGKSVAVQEAMTLGCTVLVSDCGGNREQVKDGVNGKMCEFSPEAIRDQILWLLDHPQECAQYAEAALHSYLGNQEQLEELLLLA